MPDCIRSANRRLFRNGFEEVGRIGTENGPPQDCKGKASER